MIYRDVLGRPVAGVTVSFQRERSSRVLDPGTKEWRVQVDPSYFYTSSVCDYPARQWSGDTPVSSIVADMEADGFSCEVKRNGYNLPVIICVHRETQALIDGAKAAADQKFASSSKGFIRFGRVPENGRSKNHRDGTLEAGVSCFEAEFAEDGSYRLLLTPVLEVSYLTVRDRQAYRLYGEEIGTGADGEPLLRVDRFEKA